MTAVAVLGIAPPTRPVAPTISSTTPNGFGCMRLKKLARSKVRLISDRRSKAARGWQSITSALWRDTYQAPRPAEVAESKRGFGNAGFLKPTPNRIWLSGCCINRSKRGAFAHHIQNGFEPSDRLFRSKSHINPLIFHQKQAFWSRRHDGGLVPTASLRSTPFCAAILG